VLELKQVAEAMSQQLSPPGIGAGQVFWQSASLAHADTHCPGVAHMPLTQP
jgi:hypothetical protein